MKRKIVKWVLLGLVVLVIAINLKFVVGFLAAFFLWLFINL